MGTPTNRTPVRVARGSTTALNTGLSDIQEGEIVWDTTTNKLKVKEGSALEESNQAADATKAPLASPTFTGTVAIPNVANLETAVVANTAKVTNATHTGDVTGATALTIANDAVTTVKIANDAVTAAKLDVAYAPLAAPALTGTATAVNLTLSGDLTVNGTMTTIDTDNLVVDDPLIYLARNNAANTLDIGIYGKYIDNSAPEYTGMFRDQTDSKWKLFDSLEVIPTTTVNTSGTGYTAATLVVGTLEDSKGDVRKIPRNDRGDNSYTLVASDAGKHVAFQATANNAKTLTINASVFDTGDAVTVVNHSAFIVTIAVGAGMTLYNSADGTTPTALAGRGMATFLFWDDDICYSSGAGLS